MEAHIFNFRRQKQGDPCEFESSLACKVSSRTGKAVTQRKPVLKPHPTKKKKKKKKGK